jgi:hypothetical protein
MRKRLTLCLPILLLGTLASAQIPADHFSGVRFDAPLPMDFAAGEVLLVSGTVANPNIPAITLEFASARRIVEHRIRVVRGRFEHPILFTNGEAGTYTLQVIFLPLTSGAIASNIFDGIVVLPGEGAEIEFPSAYFENRLDPVRFVPNVVDAGDDVLPPLLVRTGGDPTGVFVRLQDGNGREVERELHDDGIDGDHTADDGIYTMADAPFVPPQLENGDFGSVFALALVQYREGSLVFSADCGAVAGDLSDPEPLQRGAARSDYILNLVEPDILVSLSEPGVDMERASRRFYEYFEDDYDFLVVRSALPLANGLNGTNFKVKNEVDGIGLDLFDDTEEFGSAGRLQGTTFINFRHIGPLVHEIAHNWANYLDVFEADAFGFHWGFTDVQGVLGGYATSFELLGTNRYGVPENALNSFWGGRYSLLELYLMGLVPAADVPPHQVLGQSRIVGRDEDAGQLVVSGSLETLTIAEILEIEGERLPNFQESQKSFRMGTVVISAAPLTPVELTYYDRQTAFFGSEAEGGLAFAAATGFRASMDTRLDPTVRAVLINSDATATTPSSVALSQNYPNPFNSTTTFRFELDGSSPARLEIFTLNGQRVRRLEIDGRVRGERSVAWDGRDEEGGIVASGIYFAVLRSGAFTASKKIALIR